MAEFKIADRLAMALELLPYELKQAVQSMPAHKQQAIEELRLRCGRPFTVTLPDGEKYAGAGNPVTVWQEDILELIDKASGSSLYSVEHQLREGYITTTGGNRIGICGSTAGETLSNFSSVAVRIAREWPDSSYELFSKLFDEDGFKNTLLISPPGCGKTTLLRELVRRISEDGKLCVAVADERGELCAMKNGVPQFNVGTRTDVMDGMPKARAMLMLLKTMSPQVIAADEITSKEDIDAILDVFRCGAGIIATIHAYDVSDMKRRRLTRELMEHEVFARAIVIRKDGAVRTTEVSELY